MNENNKFDVVGTNIAEKATMIWNVADMLRGPFKPHEYGLIILPMTVVKRFHDCLLSTHKAVLEKYEELKKFAVIDGFLTTASQYLYKTSRKLVAMGMPMSVLKAEGIFEKVIAIKYDVPNDNLQLLDLYKLDIDDFYNRVIEKNA